MKRRVKWAVALGLMGIASIIVAAMWPRERLLLDRATRAAAIQDWDEYRGHKKAAFGHNWLSDQEVLFARRGVNAKNESENHYFICNMHTGLTAPAVRYEKALKLADPHYRIDFSPDRQWFYAEHWRGHGLDVVKSDGSRKYMLKEKGYPLLWLSNSLYLNDMDAEDYANEYKTAKTFLRLHSVADNRQVIDLPASPSYEPKQGKIVYCANHFIMVSEYGDPALRKASMEVIETGMGLNSYPTRKRVFAAPFPHPQDTDDFEVRLSPDGSRIAYRRVLKRVSPLLLWLHHLYPHFDPKPQRVVELWVSTLDGKQMREVGHIDVGEEKAKEEDPEQYINTYLHFEWLPSGNRLVFRYKETLYTVSAN